jgi:hypothetical protein
MVVHPGKDEFVTTKKQEMKIDITKLQEKILELQALGFDFDTKLLGDEKNGLAFELKNYSNEVGDIDLWIIIRGLGNPCFWFDGKPVTDNKRYSKNTATIIYDQYFLNNSLSYIFEELKRITNGKFEYQIIKEFGTTENDKEFWKHTDGEQIKDYFDCEYIIGEKPFKVKYDFFKPDWTYLEPKFLSIFIKSNFDYLKSMDVNYLEPEEFITFFCINKKNQEILKNKPNVFINTDLIFEQIRQDNHQIEASVNVPQTDKRWWEFWK